MAVKHKIVVPNYLSLPLDTAGGLFPDYSAMDQAFTFDPSSNQLTQCTTIQITDDSVQEATEMFQVIVTTTDPDISIRPFSNTAVVINDDDGNVHYFTVQVTVVILLHILFLPQWWM